MKVVLQFLEETAWFVLSEAEVSKHCFVNYETASHTHQLIQKMRMIPYRHTATLQKHIYNR